MSQVKPIQVKCPVCDALLSLTSEHQGESISCDRCGSKVKVPGHARGESDDDDWLRLESDFPAAPAPATRRPSKPDRRDSGPELDDADEYDLPNLDDLPLSPVSRTGPAAPPPLSESDLAALGGFADDPAEQPAPMKPVVAKKTTDDSYGVRCKVCDTLNYARPAQAGKRIRCHDCHSPILVPPPPKAKVKYQPDLEKAATYTFSDADVDEQPARPADPFRKSADEYLRAAEAADDAQEDEWELPDLRQWLIAPVIIFRDPAVTIHAVLFILLAFIPAAIALQFDSSMVVLGMFAGGAFFGALLVSCGFAILQSVANGERRVSEWPIFDPMEWLGQMVLTIAAIAVSAGPAWLLGTYIFGGGLVTVAMAMISLYLLFPVVILSMLDEQSILTPFSADVTKSMMRAADQWGAAYLCSGALFFAVFLIFMISSVSPPLPGALLAIATTVLAVFIYFGIVGRLAYGIGHAINAPPMANDIDRTGQPPQQ